MILQYSHSESINIQLKAECNRSALYLILSALTNGKP